MTGLHLVNFHNNWWAHPLRIVIICIYTYVKQCITVNMYKNCLLFFSYIHTYIYIYVCMSVCMYTYTHKYTYIYVNDNDVIYNTGWITVLYIYMHIYMHVYIRIYTYTYTYIHIYIEIHIYTYTYTYIHIYIEIHYTAKCFCFGWYFYAEEPWFRLYTFASSLRWSNQESETSSDWFDRISLVLKLKSITWSQINHLKDEIHWLRDIYWNNHLTRESILYIETYRFSCFPDVS